MVDGIILNTPISELRKRKQAVADEFDGLLTRIGVQSHPGFISTMMDLVSHPDDLFIPPFKGAGVEMVAFREVKVGDEVHQLVLYRQNIGHQCAFGELNTRTNTCVRMRPTRFVDVAVPETGPEADWEAGFAFLAEVKLIVEVFATTA